MLSIGLNFLGCGRTEYALGEAPPPAPEDTDDLPHSDLPSLSGCEMSEAVLPIDVDSYTEGGGENYFSGLCPIGLTDAYTTDEYGYLTDCMDTGRARVDAAIDRAITLFIDDVDLLDLLACKAPFTAYAEFERGETPLGAGGEGVAASGRVWLTPGYAKDAVDEDDFESAGLTDDEGRPTDIFPLDSLYAEASHLNPLEEFELDDFDGDNARDVELYYNLSAGGEEPWESTGLKAAYANDGNGAAFLDMYGGEDALAYAAPSEDYSLTGSAGSAAFLANGFFAGLAALCEVPEGEFTGGIKRCAVYFSGE